MVWSLNPTLVSALSLSTLGLDHRSRVEVHQTSCSLHMIQGVLLKLNNPNGKKLATFYRYPSTHFMKRQQGLESVRSGNAQMSSTEIELIAGSVSFLFFVCSVRTTLEWERATEIFIPLFNDSMLFCSQSWAIKLSNFRFRQIPTIP